MEGRVRRCCSPGLCLCLQSWTSSSAWRPFSTQTKKHQARCYRESVDNSSEDVSVWGLQPEVKYMKVYLALGEAPDERASRAFAAAGMSFICRVGAVVTFTLMAKKTSFNLCSKKMCRNKSRTQESNISRFLLLSRPQAPPCMFLPQL